MLQKQKLFYLNLKTNNSRLISNSNYVENDCIPLLIRYLGIVIDDKLNWNTHSNNIVLKLMRGDSILSKLRYYVNKEILRTIYFAIFYSCLTYVTTVWRQTRIPESV